MHLITFDDSPTRLDPRYYDIDATEDVVVDGDQFYWVRIGAFELQMVKTQHYLLADLLKQLVGEPASGLSVQDMQQRLHAHLNEEEMDPVTLFVVHPATQATDSIEFLADIKSIAEGTKKMAIYALFEEGSDAEESLVQSPGLVNTRDVVPLAPCMTTRRWHATPPRQLTMSSPLRRGNFVLH